MHKMNRQYQKMVFDAILGKKDIIQLLNKTKGWPEYEINQMLTLIMSKKTKSTQALIRSLFPKNYSELCPYKRFKFDMTCNIENIIGWYTEIIKCFINLRCTVAFVRLQREYRCKRWSKFA